MNAKKIRLLLWSGVLVVCIIALAECRRASEVVRAAAETAPPWTLTLAVPIDHLDALAREPMIVEHPDGTLFVGGFGAAFMSGKETDEATLWKSSDGGTTWTRVNVGTKADGVAGNSDVDLAVSPDGTLYFANLLFDVKKIEGKQISIGVSKDVGATWKWTLLSNTRFDDRPWVKVAPDGTAHVIWNDGSGVCHAVSQDGGLTWTECDRIHPQGGSSHLAVGPNGEVAVRVTPTSASGMKYDEGVDLIAVSSDGGTTWHKKAAPGTREWSLFGFPILRWVEPLAWDARGVLYSLWANLEGVWLARSVDQGGTWTTWRLLKSPEVVYYSDFFHWLFPLSFWRLVTSPELAYYPYLVARGQGELAATWFSGRAEMLHAHVARIDVGEEVAQPRIVESQPIRPDSWRRDTRPENPPIRETAGEYLAISFLRSGGLVVVSPIQNIRENRYGFSLWKVEERRGEPLPAK